MATDIIHWLGLDYIIDSNKRIFWLYLVTGIVIACLTIILRGESFASYCQRSYWWHPSAKLDYQYFLLATVIKTLLIYPLLFNAGDIALYAMKLLESTVGYVEHLQPASPPVIMAYTFCLFVLGDLTRYGLHRLMHRVPLLWAFHEVHHSAEVLTPFTFYRVHPVESILFGCRYALCTGLVTGVFVFYFGAGLKVVELLGANIFVCLAHLLGDNLRHSPIRLRYPEILEHWFISPAQHQFHHSQYGSQLNYGGVLAVWDFIFRSLRVSERNESYEIGLRDGPGYQSMNALIFKPLTFLNKGSGRIETGKVAIGVATLVVILCLTTFESLAQSAVDKQIIELGRVLYFDKNLSMNRRQSCASCHDPDAGFVDSRSNTVNSAASLGDDESSIGDRIAPMAAYAAMSPEFHFDSKNKTYSGGQFWDGRAKNLTEQAKGPFLNQAEMGMPDVASLIERLLESEYYRSSFQMLYGEEIFSDSEEAYTAAASSIARFEESDFFAPFDSKYDLYLKGEYELSDEEDLGMSLFFSTTNSNCSSCHQLKVMDDEQEPFSNFEFHNIGTPENVALRMANGVGIGFQDLGLYLNPAVSDESQKGKFKVPSLRNIAVTGPYMHNGVFESLRTVMEFYDQYNNPDRSLNPETGQPWGRAEVEENVNLDDLKAKRLSDKKIDALIAFLKTLTDRRYEHLVNP